MKQNRLKILLADDHALVRTGMRAILMQQADFEVIAEVADGHGVLSAVAEYPPDLILLDISLPGINGLDIIPRIQTINPDIGVVVLSMHNSEEYVIRAYQLGALSYLTKDAPVEELVAALKSAGMKTPYYPAGINQQQIEAFLQSGEDASLSRINRLTLREREVLQLLAEGHSTSAIALKMGISPKTVETHRAHLSEKLQLYDIASLTRFAVKCGLVTLV